MATSKDYREAYNKGQEIVPDYAYDTMFAQEEAELNDVGQGELVDHVHPMLSLPTFYLDVNNITEDVLQNVCKVGKVDMFTVSYKLDGVPCSCILTSNGWQRAVSRGKRFKGFVVSNKFLSVLPTPIKLPEPGQVIDFRGEFVLSDAAFEELKQLPEFANYANPRSLVSATINSLQPNDAVIAKLKWFAHGVWIDNKPTNHFDELDKWLSNQCIATHYAFGDKYYDTTSSLANDLAYIYDKAMNYEYPCDGIVIQYRTTTEHDGHCNLDRIAIKQFDEAKYSATTKVASIEWRLANNGSYFPRLWFEPIEINGSTVTHAAAYCYDYLKRMGISVGSEVIVTMRGGVIPYVSKVLNGGTGNLQLPADAIEPNEGDMHIWSSNSSDAVQRLKFIRGMGMLDLADCGISLFSDMYEAGFKTLFDVAKEVKQDNMLYKRLTSIGVLPETEASKAKCDTITERFRTFNYVWLILALRENNIGFKTANAIGQYLSGYTLIDSRELNKKAAQEFLANTELVELVKAHANPVALEHADLSVELCNAKQSTGTAKPKVCMSKKPSNGMKKADFAATYLQDYEITDNIREAQLLICPAGEHSNKIAYANANGIAIKYYEDFFTVAI